jgi:hypothetical protein
MRNLLAILLLFSIPVNAATLLVDSTTGAIQSPSAALFISGNGLGTSAGLNSFAADPSTNGSFSAAAWLTDLGGTTGTGALVRVTSPTLIAPALGTPTALTLTNATGLPISTGITGQAAGIVDWMTTPSSANLITAVTDETGTGSLVFSTSPVFTTPNIGTPSAAVLTNATGLPVATGVSGLGTGVATFLATPSSANLISAITDETGTGATVFATSPVLVTPNIGTPSAGVLTNATGLPLTTGVTGELPAANGGTGIASYTIGDLLYASGTTTLSKLAGVATGNALISGGVGTAPSWGKITTSHTTGIAASGANSDITQLNFTINDTISYANSHIRGSTANNGIQFITNGVSFIGNGAERLRFQTGIIVAGGSTSTPCVANGLTTNGGNTGFYFPSADHWAISVDGTQRYGADTTGFYFGASGAPLRWSHTDDNTDKLVFWDDSAGGYVGATGARFSATAIVGFAGTTTNDSATAGDIGEYVESTVATGSAVALATATEEDVTSISLTAGDWDVSGNIVYKPTGATITETISGTNTTSDTLPSPHYRHYGNPNTTTTSINLTAALPSRRVSLASTTTVYLVARSTFSAGTVAAFGYISARRAR